MKWLSVGLIVMAPLSWSSGARVEGVAFCTPENPSEDIVVYLTGAQIPVPTPPESSAVMDQRRLRFIPHVLPIVRGTTVSFPNSDAVRHNVFSPSEACMFNLGTYPPGSVREVTFRRSGVVELLCNVHPEMSAYIVVLDTPYFAKTDRQGHFQITDLLPGNYTLNFSCEHRGSLQAPLRVEPGRASFIHAVLHNNQIDQGGPPILPRPNP